MKYNPCLFHHTYYFYVSLIFIQITNRLKAFVVVGQQLPKFLDLSTGGLLGVQDLRIQVCIGAIELTTRSVKFEEGMCRWNELLRSDPIKLPADLKQIPDICIYLLRADGKPVCFSRIPAVDVKENHTLGFHQTPKWYLLQEDEVLEGLDEGEFPGSILMKLGFGRLDEDNIDSVAEWNQAMENVRSASPHQVRVHLYQGKNLPATDSNGLSDPYVNIIFMGIKYKSKVVKKSLYPEYYETHIFDNIMIPDVDNYIFCPQITFRVYDEDILGSDDYMGQCSYSLSDAVKTVNPHDEMPDPVWYDLFKAVPNDSQGQLLLNVQVIAINDSNNESLKEPVHSIKPEHQDAFIEVMVVGIRDLQPYMFIPIQYPFVEFELNSLGSKYTQTTEPSKRPAPDNPNYLVRLMMPCRLPKKSIYTSPLLIRVKDTRLGGYQKPIVGISAIDLTHKLPWALDTYIKPQTDIFKKPDVKVLLDADGNAIDEEEDGGLDEVGMEALILQNERMEQLADDELIASQDPPNINQLIKKRSVNMDTGAGVFGALNHITLDGKKRKKAEHIFTDPVCIYLCMCVCLCMCVYAYMYVYMCIYVSMYELSLVFIFCYDIYMDIYIYIYIIIGLDARRYRFTTRVDCQ